MMRARDDSVIWRARRVNSNDFIISTLLQYNKIRRRMRARYVKYYNNIVQIFAISCVVSRYRAVDGQSVRIVGTHNLMILLS